MHTSANITDLRINDYDPFGMIISGRTWEAGSEYRFGFNGQEQDRDVTNTQVQLDFGFRIYNPQIGKWLSTDPLQAKFASWSPYSFVMANPITQVDIEGKENVIYLVVLPSAYPSLTPSDIRNIQNLANSNFQALGVKTRVVLASEECKCEFSAFDPNKIDVTDGIAVIGAAQDVQTYINSFGTNSMKWDNFADNGNVSNPETSENRGENGNGKWTAIDALDIPILAGQITTGDKLSHKKAQLGALFINHGVGHQAGMNHAGGQRIDDQVTIPTDEGYTFSQIMQTGRDLISDINDPEIGYARLTSDSFEHRDVFYFYTNPNGSEESKRRIVTTYNSDYDRYVKARFSDNEAKANYE